MTRYAFNGYLFSQRQTGVMRFAKEILIHIDEKCSEDEFVLVVPEYAANVPTLNNIKIVRFGKTKGNLWEQIDFVKYLRKNNFQSVNFNNTMPIFRPGIITIHDIAYKIHPEFADSLHGRISNLYHRLIFFIVSKSKVPIITVTNFSKYQLIDEYKIDPSRIMVIGNGWQHFQSVMTDDSIIMKNNLVPKSYYFSLGSLSKMKNTNWIIEVAKKNPNDVFVLAGARPNNSAFYSEIPTNVIMVGFVSDEQVKSLIKNCKAFIYPSIFDGFGIPPLEALSQGAIVVCSDAACLTEVYRNSVHYIDPYNTDVDLDILLSERVDTSSAVLDRYSWEKSSIKMYEFLKESSYE